MRILLLKRGSYSLDRSKMSLFSPRRDNSLSGETTLAQKKFIKKGASGSVKIEVEGKHALPGLEGAFLWVLRGTTWNLGKDIILDAKTFNSLCCNIPIHGSTTGFGLVCEWDNYERKEFYYSLYRISKEEIELHKQHGFGETVKNRDILSVGHLKLEDRLLHYFLSYVILPKFSNHSQISDMELQLMYAVKYNIEINWAWMIMRQMWNVRGSQSPLPYAIFITNILKHFKFSTAGKTKVALNLCESKIDVEVVHKMDFSIDPQDRRTCKHKTDRLTAPTAEQPEPTYPNPFEFHAQSSSFAAMPSN
ncbi:hypothetical protein Lal_00030251 [Lupinus albus]|nr:hypothetical protein Lal_00030251 [Lupinus albus]